MKDHHRFGYNGPQKKYVSLALFGFLACAVWLGQGSLNDVLATTIYSYIDDFGDPVYTDDPESIPWKYRARAKAHERDPDSTRSSVMDSVQRTVNEQAKSYGFEVSWLKRFSPSRVGLLPYAGGVAFLLLVMMYLCKNSPLLRLMAFGLLIILGITTPVLMYTSDGGPMDIMKDKAIEAEQAQENRLQQIPQ